MEIAVKELLEGGYDEKVAILPHVCSPISVVTSGRGEEVISSKFKAC